MQQDKIIILNEQDEIKLNAPVEVKKERIVIPKIEVKDEQIKTLNLCIAMQ